MVETYYILYTDADGICFTAKIDGDKLEKVKKELEEEEGTVIRLVCTQEELAAWVSAAL